MELLGNSQMNPILYSSIKGAKGSYICDILDIIIGLDLGLDLGQSNR